MKCHRCKRIIHIKNSWTKCEKPHCLDCVLEEALGLERKIAIKIGQDTLEGKLKKKKK